MKSRQGTQEQLACERSSDPALTARFACVQSGRAIHLLPQIAFSFLHSPQSTCSLPLVPLVITPSKRKASRARVCY